MNKDLLVFPRADIADFRWWFIRLRLLSSGFRHSDAGGGFFSAMTAATTATTTAGQANNGRCLFWWMQHDHCHFTRRFNCCNFRSFRLLRLPWANYVAQRHHFGRTLWLWNGNFGASTAGGSRRKHCAGRIPRTDIRRQMAAVDTTREAALLRWRAANIRRLRFRLVDRRTRSRQDALRPAACDADRWWRANRLPRADVIFRRKNRRRIACTARSDEGFRGEKNRKKNRRKTKNIKRNRAIPEFWKYSGSGFPI